MHVPHAVHKADEHSSDATKIVFKILYWQCILLLTTLAPTLGIPRNQILVTEPVFAENYDSFDFLCHHSNNKGSRC